MAGTSNFSRRGVGQKLPSRTLRMVETVPSFWCIPGPRLPDVVDGEKLHEVICGDVASTHLQKTRHKGT